MKYVSIDYDKTTEGAIGEIKNKINNLEIIVDSLRSAEEITYAIKDLGSIYEKGVKEGVIFTDARDKFIEDIEIILNRLEDKISVITRID